MWLRTGQLANRVQDIALAYRCAVIMPEGGSIWELYHGCYLGYKPNQDINYTNNFYFYCLKESKFITSMVIIGLLPVASGEKSLFMTVK